jgi:tagatose-6-phosphate ketose/aldose isomerase
MDLYEKFYGKGAAFFASKNCSVTSAEIAQQPEIWRELCASLIKEKQNIADFFHKLADLKKIRIILTGAGSSAFIGEAIAFIIGKTRGILCEAVHSTDIVSAPRSVLFENIPTLLISFGRSGNSPESACAVKYARSIVKDLYETAVLCDNENALYKITRESEKSLILLMPKRSNDKAFAMTGSLTCMLLACFAFFNIDKLEEVIKNIILLAENVEGQSIKLSETAEKWAQTRYNRLIVLGSGCCRGLAREAALKTMELSSGIVNAAYDNALAFRHGPKSVINETTLTIHIISHDPLTAKYDVDLLREIYAQKNGNRVIALGGKQLAFEADEKIVIPSDGYGIGADLWHGINCLIFCQLLAMYKSINLTIPTDNPALNGKLNRVVKGVSLYELNEQNGIP